MYVAGVFKEGGGTQKLEGATRQTLGVSPIDVFLSVKASRQIQNEAKKQ